MKKYWMVHRPGTSTTYMHPIFESAMAEARRLRKVFGGVFVVLEAIGTLGVPDDLPRIDFEDFPY